MPGNQEMKCAHPACRCSVSAGQRYCSTYCEQHQQQGQSTGKGQQSQSPSGCGCGHAACQHQWPAPVPGWLLGHPGSALDHREHHYPHSVRTWKLVSRRPSP